MKIRIQASFNLTLFFVIASVFFVLRQFHDHIRYSLTSKLQDLEVPSRKSQIVRHNSSIPNVQVLPNDFVEEKGSRRYPIVVEEYKLIFFTIQKNGNTVWKQLFRRMIGQKDWRNGMTWGNETGLKTLQDYSLEEATQLMNDPTYIRAIFVRDPKERFLSAYLDKVINTDYFFYYCCHRRRRKKHVEECHNQSRTMEGFLELTDKHCPNSHWGPLSKRMDPKYLPLLDFVGHLENAARDAKILLEEIGAWETYGRTGWGLHGNESIFATRSYVQHKTSNQTNDYQSRMSKHYTPETEALVEKRFAQDYAIPVYNLTMKKIDFRST